MRLRGLRLSRLQRRVHLRGLQVRELRLPAQAGSRQGLRFLLLRGETGRGGHHGGGVRLRRLRLPGLRWQGLQLHGLQVREVRLRQAFAGRGLRRGRLRVRAVPRSGLRAGGLCLPEEVIPAMAGDCREPDSRVTTVP
mgnify:CR=1 FL=1